MPHGNASLRGRGQAQLAPLYLECIKTGPGEYTEDPYLHILVDPTVDSEATHTWGPHDMQSGDTRQLNLPALLGHQIAIHLIEWDPCGCTYHDRLGGFEVWGHDSGRILTAEEMAGRIWTAEELAQTLRELDFTKNEYGPHHSGFHYVTLPYHEGPYDQAERRYRLYFYLYSDENADVLGPPYCLELVSLECINAQEWKDYPYIKVNGLKVWGSKRMRDRGDASFKSIDVDPIQIYEVTSVMLWEKDDSNRDDLFGEFEIRIGRDFEFDQELSHTFSWRGSSSVDDARYNLTYRVTQRELRSNGTYGRCPDT